MGTAGRLKERNVGVVDDRQFIADHDYLLLETLSAGQSSNTQLARDGQYR
jgi:hypothetical protein